MLRNPVYAAVRRSNRMLLLLSGSALLITCALLALNWRYWYNFALGPTAIASQDLGAITDPNQPQRYWITARGDEVFDTGVQYVRETDSGKEEVEHSYMALRLGDRLLLVKTPNQTPVTQYGGALVSIPSDVHANTVAAFAREQPELKDVFLPYMLDATNFRQGGYIGLGLAAVVLLGSVVGLVLALRRIADPLSHPVMRRLARYGQPDAVAREIEHELMTPSATLGKVHITPHWLVFAKGGTFEAARLEDLVWLYKHVTQYRYYGVIPVAKNSAAHLRDRFGHQIKIPQRRGKQVDQLLELAHQYVPWAIAGFDKQIEQAWKKQRSELIAAVDDRRQHFQAENT